MIFAWRETLLVIATTLLVLILAESAGSYYYRDAQTKKTEETKCDAMGGVLVRGGSGITNVCLKADGTWQKLG